MQNNYTYGEIIYILNEEYSKYKYLLEELKKSIKVDECDNFDFRSVSLDKENLSRIKLIIKKYKKPIIGIIKKKNVYYAQYSIVKINNHYMLKPNTSIPEDYQPNITIIDDEKFNQYLDFLLSSRLVNLKSINKEIDANHDLYISYDYSKMSTPSSYVSWSGINNYMKYKNSIEGILSYQIPSELIPNEWSVLLQKYREKIENPINFILEGNIHKTGQLVIESTYPTGKVKLLTK